MILPLTVLRRLDCVLEPTKEKVLAKAKELKEKKLANVEPILNRAAGQSFHNTSKLTFEKLKDDPNNIAANLTHYIKGFSISARSSSILASKRKSQGWRKTTVFSSSSQSSVTLTYIRKSSAMSRWDISSRS